MAGTARLFLLAILATNAATVACTELLIHAPPKAIWLVLTGIDRWTEWMPEFASARLEGPLASTWLHTPLLAPSDPIPQLALTA